MSDQIRHAPTATTADFEAAVDEVVPPGHEFETMRRLRSHGAVGLAGLLVSALVALGPGWHAARLRPAQALRVE